MRAAVIEQFGGPDELRLADIDVPRFSEAEILLRVHAAGIGEWDPFEREGGYEGVLGSTPAFPYVLGSEGAGVVAAIGAAVENVRVGERVYACAFLNPKGGLYAEYAAVPADMVAPVPEGLTLEQAAAAAGVGITALRGLEDILNVEPGQSILIVGAGGGVGHLALQIARRKGVRVFAVASGRDGVALAEELGAEAVIEGHDPDGPRLLRERAGSACDAALATAGGDEVNRFLAMVREGGRIAYPNGVEPAPVAPPGVDIQGYDADPDPEIARRFADLLRDDGLRVHVAHTFALDEAAEAHRHLERHYLGKLVLRID